VDLLFCIVSLTPHASFTSAKSKPIETSEMSAARSASVAHTVFESVPLCYRLQVEGPPRRPQPRVLMSMVMAILMHQLLALEPMH